MTSTPPSPPVPPEPLAPPEISESAPRPLVLLIEDEAPIRRFLRATLTAHGYRVNEAATARDGSLQASMHPPDLIILDLGLPDGDGIDLARELRVWSHAPIIVLSARGLEVDKVAALDAGADDYLTKPFGTAELLARLRVALRHATTRSEGGSPIYSATVDGRTLRIDFGARSVEITETPDAAARLVSLTPTEYKLLAHLAVHGGKVLTHRQLLIEVWGPPHAGDVQYLRVYAGQLRGKLERDPAQPRLLLTEPGVGYRLAAPTR